MPQYPAVAYVAKTPGNVPAQLQKDAYGSEYVNAGAQSSALNKTAAAVIKAAPGRLMRIVVVDPGTTGGAFTLNDCAATADAAAGNVIWSQAYNATAAVKGQVITLDWPCAVGIVLSAVPSGGTPILAISYI